MYDAAPNDSANEVLARLAAGDLSGLGDDPKRLVLPSPAAASCLGVSPPGLVPDPGDAGVANGVANGEGRPNELGVVYRQHEVEGESRVSRAPLSRRRTGQRAGQEDDGE